MLVPLRLTRSIIILVTWGMSRDATPTTQVLVAQVANVFVFAYHVTSSSLMVSLLLNILPDGRATREGRRCRDRKSSEGEGQIRVRRNSSSAAKYLKRGVLELTDGI